MQRKQYRSCEDIKRGLKYCSIWFIYTIRAFERVFLYIFEHYRHVHKFSQLANETITKMCNVPVLCNKAMSNFLVRYYVRMRIFQCVKLLNKRVMKSSRKKVEKMKKLNVP